MATLRTTSTGPLRACFLAALAVSAVLCFPGQASTQEPRISIVDVTNGSGRFAGDGPLVTTISPNGDRFRDHALVRVHLSTPMTVRMRVTVMTFEPKVVFERHARLSAGLHTLTWAPRTTTSPSSYSVLVDRADGADHGPISRAVVRVQAISAAAAAESYAPGAVARLSVATDARRLELQVFQAGPEATPTVSDVDIQGRAVTGARTVDVPSRSAPFALTIKIGDWPSGLYFARLRGDTRVGYAPFVVRPRRLGEHRVAVVLPTYTWQAYNFADADGDGWPDTWYAGWSRRTVLLGRPFAGWGMPPYFRNYDAPFLEWLAHSGRAVDVLSDADLGRVGSGDALARAYDLVVFPGHHEYVTTHEYSVVRRFRDLGGNLMFLSANNFFWRIVQHGRTIERTAQWRDLGRPEASLVGVQYRGNDEGQRRGPWIVRNTKATPWLWAGTGLRTGSRFGVGGIEIDATTGASPRGTKVLAEIPHLYGPRFTAQMAYYETARGAKVFAAGAFTLAGQADDPIISQLLKNLWSHLARP
jgi:hypothetical protein